MAGLADFFPYSDLIISRMNFDLELGVLVSEIGPGHFTIRHGQLLAKLGA